MLQLTRVRSKRKLITHPNRFAYAENVPRVFILVSRIALSFFFNAFNSVIPRAIINRKMPADYYQSGCEQVDLISQSINFTHFYYIYVHKKSAAAWVREVFSVTSEF